MFFKIKGSSTKAYKPQKNKTGPIKFLCYYQNWG